MYPEINIIINKNSTSLSNYNYYENTIYLNGVFDELTFFHELTHLFSHTHFNFTTPKEYNDFKNQFLSSKNNRSLLFSFIELCEAKKKKIFRNIHSNNLNNNNIINSETMNSIDDDLIELSIIEELEDIVDAITRGESHDLGLHSEVDSNHIAQKLPKSPGHGCEYFAISDHEFEEILANYQSINLVNPDNELFNILKTILGGKFIDFLDNRCRQMNDTKIGLENNNNIRK